MTYLRTYSIIKTVKEGQDLNRKEQLRMEEIREMTEKEMQTVKMSTLYELRLIFTQGDKKEYTTDEIVELLDKIATAKDRK